VFAMNVGGNSNRSSEPPWANGGTGAAVWCARTRCPATVFPRRSSPMTASTARFVYESVLYQSDDLGIVTITLDRPESLNSFNLDMLGAFCQALYVPYRDPACRVLGPELEAGPSLAGADVKMFNDGLLPPRSTPVLLQTARCARCGPPARSIMNPVFAPRQLGCRRGRSRRLSGRFFGGWVCRPPGSPRSASPPYSSRPSGAARGSSSTSAHAGQRTLIRGGTRSAEEGLVGPACVNLCRSRETLWTELRSGRELLAQLP